MSEQQQRTGMPLGILLLTALATGSYLLVSSPLESTRHTEEMVYTPMEFVDESVGARSWQDPLRAINADWQGMLAALEKDDGKLPLGVHSPPTLLQFAKSWRQQRANDTRPPTLVGILTASGPFAEDAEIRRRQRQALFTALSQLAELPVYPDRIGYFLVPRNPVVQSELVSRCDGCRLVPPPLLVGYEQFGFEKQSKYGRLLVLWMRSSDFAGTAIRDFAEIARITLGDVSEWDAELRPRIALIGPDNSDDLRKLVQQSPETPSRFQLSSTQSREEIVFAERPAGIVEPESSPRDELSYQVSPALRRLESTEDLQEIVLSNMLAEVHSYLDHGLRGNARKELQECFGSLLNPSGDGEQKVLSQCFEGESVKSIQDSDEDWRQTIIPQVSGILESYLVVRDKDGGRRKSQYLALMLANDYLDSGLPDPGANADEVIECVTTAEWSGSLRDSCNRIQYSIHDSDLTWLDTVRSHYSLAVGQLQDMRVGSDQTSDKPDTASSADEWRGEMVVLSPRASIPPERFPSMRPRTPCMSVGEGQVTHQKTTPPRAEAGPGAQCPESDQETGSSVDEKLTERLEVKIFHSVISRDDAILPVVLNELKMRGIRPCAGHDDAIAVLYELDSSYGRELESILREESEELWGGSEKCEPSIYPYAYLRGVDGETAPARFSAGNEPSQSDTRSDSAGETAFRNIYASGHPEAAAGPAQLDYVRRLAQQIASGPRVSAGAKVKRFRAIGVLGSDVYDKQLIFKALREHLPGVVLFTTDLDARLISARNHRWTHNVLVGSAYGFNLPEYLEVGDSSDSNTAQPASRQPPFRGTYQTAFYRAAKIAAFRGISDTLITPPPRLFEIGRSTAVDITVQSDRDERPRGLERPSYDGIDASGPTGWTQHSGSSYTQVAVALLLCSPLLLLATSNWSMWLRHDPLTAGCVDIGHRDAAVVATTAVVPLLAVLWLWRDPAREPLLLAEGVSALPTLVLQLTAIVFAICLVRIAWARLCEANSRLTKAYFRELGPNVSQPRFQDILRSTKFMRASMLVPRLREPRQMKALQLWRQYLAFGALSVRFSRAFVPAALATGAIYLLLQFEVSPALARNLAGLTEAIRYLSAGVSLFLLFFCTDALKLSQYLLHSLQSGMFTGFDSAAADDGNEADPYSISSSPEFATVDAGVREQIRLFQFVLDYTKWVTPLMVYPALVMAILLISRSTIFEGWRWSSPTILIYVVLTGYLLIRAYQYQRTARQIQQRIVFNLRIARARLELSELDSQVEVAKIAEDEVSMPRQGAFVPWTRHPLLQSIALPSGGVGVLALIEALF